MSCYNNDTGQWQAKIIENDMLFKLKQKSVTDDDLTFHLPFQL